MKHILSILVLLIAATACARPDTYTVFGKEYTVLKDPKGFTQTGLCSWYGGHFHGKKTANGEVFNMNKVSAAHKTLPLGSVVEITNLDNHKKLVVTINDRGPFVKDRIIDVSFAAAKELGMVGSGTANVKIRYLGERRASTPPPLQVGAFKSAKSAQKRAQDIRKALAKNTPASFHIRRQGSHFTLVIQPRNQATFKFLKDKLNHLQIEFFELKS